MSTQPFSRFVEPRCFPIDDASSANYQRLVDRCRHDLNENGVSVLPEFLRPDILREIIDSWRDMLPLAFRQAVFGNAYLSETKSDYPPEHPINRVSSTRLGVIAYDQLADNHILRQLYHHADFTNFVARCIGREHLHEYECPLGKINIAVMSVGDHLRWHFDQSDFVVSIPLQEPEAGGAFEFAHNLRSAAEPNYAAVAAVLDGDRSCVQVLDTPPGSLVLFEGRYTLHRVTEIRGQRPRMIALLGYASEPGVTSTPYLRTIRYGRES